MLTRLALAYVRFLLRPHGLSRGRPREGTESFMAAENCSPAAPHPMPGLPPIHKGRRVNWRTRCQREPMVAQEPITIFAHILDPAGVARLLREQAATAKIDGPDDSWANAVVTFGDGTSKRTLTFKHNPEYYSEPGWSRQKAGMRGYFSRFPDSPRKPQVMLLTSSFRFSIGSIFEPDYAPDGDERLDLLFKVAQLLDGVLFTPTSLRDAHGRILLSCEGQKHEDPAAEWPRVLGEVSVSTAAGAAMHEISRPGPPNEARDDDDPPIAERVARRALALVAVTGRAILEQDDPKAETVQQTFADLKTWVKDIEITEEFEPEERQLVDCPLGQLEQRQQT